MKNLTKLTIDNAIFYSYFGVEKQEKQLGGKYEVDLELWYNSLSAITNDNVANAVNYQNVLFLVSDFMQNENYNLIETLAYNILKSIMQEYQLLEKVTIRIRKCNAPVRNIINYVEVEQTIER